MLNDYLIIIIVLNIILNIVILVAVILMDVIMLNEILQNKNFAKCHSAEWNSGDCYSATWYVIPLTVILMNVVLLIVTAPLSITHIFFDWQNQAEATLMIIISSFHFRRKKVVSSLNQNYSLFRLCLFNCGLNCST